MMEEKKLVTYEFGTLSSTTWMFDEIRLGHAIGNYNRLDSFKAGNKNDVVRFHFGLKGNYAFTYVQLNRSFDLIGGHHNIMYSKDFDIVIENKTLEIETFGIQFPKDVFVKFTEQVNEPLQRFADDVLNGRSAILSEKWGSINPPIQQS